MEFKLLKPFGPSVVKTQIPEKMVNDLNEYIDQIINDEKKLDLLNYGNKLAGDVSQEFKLEADFAKKVGWTDFLAKTVFDKLTFCFGKLVQRVYHYHLFPKLFVHHFLL